MATEIAIDSKLCTRFYRIIQREGNSRYVGHIELNMCHWSFNQIVLYDIFVDENSVKSLIEFSFHNLVTF